MFIFPDIPFIMRLRGFFYRIGMKECGKDFQVTHDAIIKGLQRICIGSHCFVGNGTIIMGEGSIVLEDEVSIGPHVIIISSNHLFIKGSYRFKRGDCGSIIIGKGAWVAGNCTVVQGSRLPAGSVLGANSLLNKEFTVVNSIYGGVPAKYIKTVEDSLS